jgi:lysophospholipase L1-like esterase
LATLLPSYARSVTKSPVRLVVLGDSVAEGLGVKERSFPDLLARGLEELSPRPVRLDNFSGLATPLASSVARLDEVVALDPDVVVVHHGITEGLVRPTARTLRFMPRRWRAPGWMDPRPFFSSRRWKRALEKLDSAARWRIKTMLIRHWGGQTSATPEEFERDLSALTSRLVRDTRAGIVLVSHCGLDERFFVGSGVALERCRAATASVASREPERVWYCDVTTICDRWGDYFADRMHPNAHGHELIAGALLRLIEDERVAPCAAPPA